MTVIHEGANAVYVGAPAALIENDREMAWAERYVIQNPAYKYVLGKFVEADNPNDNGHLFPFEELKAAQSTISYSPLNMLHRQHHVIGAFVATEMVYPTAGEEQAALENPYVEALAAMWRYAFPDEYNAIEKAHKEGQLFYSMECVPGEVGCIECSQVYAYQGRAHESYCAHLNEPGSVKKLHKPHFVGGAIIIPPTRPGWKRADITELSSLIERNVAEAERVYAAFKDDFSHLTPAEWEQMMLQTILHAAQAEIAPK